MAPQLRNIVVLLGVAVIAVASFFFGRSTAKLDLPPPIVARALDPAAVAVDVKVWPPQTALPVSDTARHYAAVLYSDGNVGCTYPQPGAWPPECHNAAALLDMSLVAGAPDTTIFTHADTVRSALMVDGVVVATHETIVSHADTAICDRPADTVPPPPAAPPAAPDSLQRPEYNAARTAWVLVWRDNASDEEGFEVWRCMECVDKTAGWVDWSLHATVGADVTSFEEAPALTAKEYGYQVRAVNAAGQSAFAGPVYRRYLP